MKSNLFKKANRILIGAVLIFIFTVGRSSLIYGYIMPAEQILGLMLKNYSKLYSLIIKQSTVRVDQNGEKIFEEMVHLKSPDYSRLDSPDYTGRIEDPDMIYRRLLISNEVSSIQELMAFIGIDQREVTLTRIDGIIAYCIGDKEPGKPKLLIEKERFLPLLLAYRSAADRSGDIFSIRFSDYRKPNETWYPYKIEYSDGKGVREIYSIVSIQPNVPVDDSIIHSTDTKKREPPAPEVGENPDLEEDQLRKVIKAFEEKYR